MATPVDTLLVEVTADLRDVRRKLGQLEKDTKRTADKSAQNMKRLATAIKTVVGAVIIREFIRAGKSAVDFAANVQEMRDKSSVVFKEFAGEVRKELDEFGAAVGRSSFQLEEMAARVQDTFVPMGFARGEAADLSVRLTKLATDVASLNNEVDSEVMIAFQSALVGNHETVRRFGVVIDEARLKSELFNMGITKSYKQVTAAEKVQARFNIIMAGTEDAHGNAALTADSYVNQVKAMDRELEILTNNIGEAVMPAFRGLVSLTTDLAKGFNEAFEEFQPSSIDEATAAIEEQEKKVALLEKTLKDATTGLSGLAFAAGGNLTDGIVLSLMAARKELARLEAERGALQNPPDKATPAAPDVINRLGGVQTKGEGENLGAEIIKQANARDLLTAQTQTLSAVERELLEVESELGVMTDEQAEKYRDAGLAIEQLKLKMQGLDEVQGALKGGVEALSSGTSQAMTDMVTGVGDGMQGLKNVVSEAITSIIKKMIEMYVVNKAINAALGFFGAPQSMMLATAASGGAIQPNRPTLVGERGPELIIPKSASVVKNAADTQGMVGGGSPIVVNQSLNFSTGVQATVRSEVMTMMPQIQEATKAAVSEQAQRGGSYTRAF
jgi:hypothetical protein